jgi:hypothetical protein
MKFLGFIVSTKGVEVDPAKIVVVQDWQALFTVKGVQGFLSFYNFYRYFIKEYGQIARPLNILTQGIQLA